MHKDDDKPDFSRPVLVDSIPNRGIERTIEASAEERGALARRFGLQALTAFQAVLKVRPGPADTYRVTGHLQADVVQSCVVTLDPVEHHVEDSFEASFAEERGKAALSGKGEIELDMSEEDPPEPITGGAIDLGELAAQYLSLALDPYPRRADVDLSAMTSDISGIDGPAGPFAALSKLKQAL